MVTSHLYDGVRSLPLDVALYKHASSLPKGKDDEEFKKKPELALELIDKCLNKGQRSGMVLLDGGYGNNSSLLKELEARKLEYCVTVAKNRNVIWSPEENTLWRKNRLDEVAELITPLAFQKITLPREKTKTVWIALVQVEISRLKENRTVAIVMNAPSVSKATEIDYLLTNVIELFFPLLCAECTGAINSSLSYHWQWIGRVRVLSL